MVIAQSGRQLRKHQIFGDAFHLSILLLSIFGYCLVSPLDARAQNHIDLDDLKIKGEVLNDNRMRLSSRHSSQMEDRISYRTNFRDEIVDGLEIAWPEVELRKPAGRTSDASSDDAAEASGEVR